MKIGLITKLFRRHAPVGFGHLTERYEQDTNRKKSPICTVQQSQKPIFWVVLMCMLLCAMMAACSFTASEDESRLQDLDPGYYVASDCIYQVKLPSLNIQNPPRYCYFQDNVWCISENQLCVEYDLGDLQWQEFPFTDTEWNAQFPQDPVDISVYERQKYLQLDEVYELLLMDGTLWLIIRGTNQIWWIYSLEHTSEDPISSNVHSTETQLDDIKKSDSSAGIEENVPATPAQDLSLYTHAWDPQTPITSEEFVLSNGIRMKMTYEEVLDILGTFDETPDIPNANTGYFHVSADGIIYTFYRLGGGSYRLKNLHISEECKDITFFREIGPGQNIDEVFAKIPAQDTELKQWASQVLYEKDGYNSYLEFIAMSFYGMRIETPTMSADITFSRDGTNVKYINVSAR